MTPEERYEANEQLAYFALYKTMPSLMYDEDMQQIAKIGLWKACGAFQENNGVAFSSFACRVIHNEVLMEFRRMNTAGRTCDTISLSSQLLGDGDATLQDTIPGDPDVDERGLLWEQIARALSERELMIVRMWIAGAKQYEIAAHIGVTASRVSRALQIARQKIRSCLGGSET